MVKKNLASLPTDFKRMLVDAKSPVTVTHQCRLLGLCRSSLYYELQPISGNSLLLLNKLDELYTQWPFYGSRRLTHELNLEGFL